MALSACLGSTPLGVCPDFNVLFSGIKGSKTSFPGVIF